MEKTGKVLHTYPISLSAPNAPMGPWPRDATRAPSSRKSRRLIYTS
jgi:hypothetical protein